MNNQYISIDTYCDVQSGFAFPSTSFVGSGIPIVRMSDLKAGKLKFKNTKYVPDSWLRISAPFILKRGDFLLGMSGSLSNYAVVTKDDEPALLNQRVGRLKQRDENVDYDYICYWLKSSYYTRYADIQGEGAAQKNISAKQIGRFKYREIPLEKQKKISLILNSIEAAIEKTEALIHKYQQIKAGLMNDLFTRGVTADGKLRPPREQAPELYKETPIGWIPKEWTTNYLKSHVKSTEYGISTSLSDLENGIPVLRMNNIQQNGFEVLDLKYSDNPEAYKIKLKPKDILYNRTNSMEHVGKTAIWKGELESCSFASYLVRINLHTDTLISEYFSYWMSQVSSQNAIRRFATPAVQQVNINPTNLQKIIISVPIDIDEQVQIVHRLESYDRVIDIEKQKLFKLEKQKSGLMEDLLTGKVQVKTNQEKPCHV